MIRILKAGAVAVFFLAFNCLAQAEPPRPPGWFPVPPGHLDKADRLPAQSIPCSNLACACKGACECLQCECVMDQACACKDCKSKPVVQTVTAPPPTPKVTAAPARLELTVPPDAQVWIDDQPTSRRGSFRTFVSPPIDFDAEYRVKVLWRGQERTETIKVYPGKTSRWEYTPESYGGSWPAASPVGTAPVYYPFAESGVLRCSGGG